MIFEILDTGTATPGVDYYHVPETYDVWMAPNVSLFYIWVQALKDAEDDDDETVVAQIRDARYCYAPQSRLAVSNASATWTITEPETDLGKFHGPDNHDGQSRFTTQLMLSNAVRNTRNEMRDEVVIVTGGGGA